MMCQYVREGFLDALVLGEQKLDGLADCHGLERHLLLPRRKRLQHNFRAVLVDLNVVLHGVSKDLHATVRHRSPHDLGIVLSESMLAQNSRHLREQGPASLETARE